MEELKQRLAELEKRVINLVIKEKVLAAIAIIFGLTGAWGYDVLLNTKHELDELDVKVDRLTTQINLASKKIENIGAEFNNLIKNSENILDEVTQHKKSELLAVVDTWPAGSYCIVKKDTCPAGFSESSIHLDTEDDKPSNSSTGTVLPQVDLGSNNVDFHFCCK